MVLWLTKSEDVVELNQREGQRLSAMVESSLVLDRCRDGSDCICGNGGKLQIDVWFYFTED